MLPQFEQFIRERQFLKNVTPGTIEWYRQSLRWLPSETPSADDLKETVIRMREKGRNAAGCNSAISAINSYLVWSGSGQNVPRLKTPKAVMPTFTSAQVGLLVRWTPKGFYERRLKILVLLDTGAQISEALSLRVSDVDLDNLLVTLDGKGKKQRIVPFSIELRKALFRYTRDTGRRADVLLLASDQETKLARRNMLRDAKALCLHLGFKAPPRTLHAFRHTFAINYLRRGGSVFHLQKVLGHSSLEMTRRYANLMTEDLQAVHERVSLLTAR